MQAPRISRASLIKAKGTARTLANAAAQEILTGHWQGIVRSIGNFLSLLKSNYVSDKPSCHFSSMFRFDVYSLHGLSNFLSPGIVVH